MKRFIVKTLAVMLVCIFVLSGINFSIFASSGNLGDTLSAVNVTISGQIKMLFYFTNVGNVDYYNVQVGDDEVRTVHKANMPTDLKNDTIRYILEVPLAAAQQADEIIITPCTKDGRFGKVRTYTARKYVDQVLALPTAAVGGANYEAALALKSMINYGAMAQDHFNYNESNPANSGWFFGATNPVNNMTKDDLYGIDAPVHNMSEGSKLNAKIKFDSANAYLNDVVSLRFYLDFDENEIKPEDLRITIENTDMGNQIYKDGDKWYVLVNNIPATKYNYQYTVIVSDGGENWVSLKYSVLNYVQGVFDNTSGDDAQRKTAAAMFRYYVDMWKYARKTDAVGTPDLSDCTHERSYVEDGSYKEICSDCGEDITPTNLLENAANLSNKVNAYYGYIDGTTDPYRQNYVIENSNMKFSTPLLHEDDQRVTITNANKGVYVADTMDVYVKIGNTEYRSSNSITSSKANIFRYGYYYYDAHIYGQNFMADGATVETTEYSLSNFITRTKVPLIWPTQYKYSLNQHSMTCEDAESMYNGGDFVVSISSLDDPYLYSKAGSYSTDNYDAVQITMSTDSISSIQMFYLTSEETDYKDETRFINFDTIPDGESHTYTIYLPGGLTVTGLRFDPTGPVGATMKITSINFVNTNAPALLLDRGIHTYADKMHQALSLVATKEATGITEVGMETKIAKSTVVANEDGYKFVVFDGKNTYYDTLTGFNWDDVEYVGFNIDGAGVFGYILPADDQHCGTITITVETIDDVEYYVIRQTIVPDENKIYAQPTLDKNSPQEKDAEGNPIKTILQTFIDNTTLDTSKIGTSLNIYNSPTQFYFGQRIYTDATHSFEAFLKEAEIERNPLDTDNIKVNKDKTPNATFDGYDAIRGMYAFTIPENVSFSTGYYTTQNFNGAVSFSVTGTDNRNIYVMAYSYGCTVEGGAVLDKNEMLLPIPTEVSKNFDHEFEEPMYLWGDVGYSEVRIPVSVNEGETQELTVLQTYMNWGQYPLKQISSIQFFAPYYHLSTGVSESNCIANYYVYGKDLQTLPDHRAASAPLWEDDPQHDNGGYHYFLQYTDSSGKKVASDTVSSVINSAGLTYADIDMTYVSDDGNIEVTYTHLEMPQTDENRAYYTMTYKVLDDISIKEFYQNFSFYSVRAYGTGYTKLGYLDENNVEQVTNAKNTSGQVIKLGSDHPYFDMFGTTTTSTQNANVSFLIDSAKVDLNADGTPDSTSFAVYEKNGTAALTLYLNTEAGEQTTTISEGATITINAIIMPWGNEDNTDDILVQNVRENTLVNPVKATYQYNGNTVTSDDFLPVILSENGVDATFTIGNGYAYNPSEGYNVTFRVDGFKILGVPRLYKIVDGEDQLVELSSINSADSVGHAHNYDGYAVHYNKDSDGNVTYSYSFVTTISGSEGTTYKVVVDDTYVDWEETRGNLCYGPQLLNKYASSGANLGSKLSDDGKYVILENKDTNDPRTGDFEMIGGGMAARYMVIKYNMPANNAATDLQFYMSTEGKYDGANDYFSLSSSIIKKDGNWHVMVVDLAAIVADSITRGEKAIAAAQAKLDTAIAGGNAEEIAKAEAELESAKSIALTDMNANDVGIYSLKSLRFDPFTTKSTNSYYIEYIAFCKDIEDAVKMNAGETSNMSYVTSVNTSTSLSDKIAIEQGSSHYNAIYEGDVLYREMFGGRWDTNSSGVNRIEAELTKNDDGSVRVAGRGFIGITLSEGLKTGKYLVIKYRADKAPTSSNFWIYTSSGLVIDDDAKMEAHGLVGDGEWHILAVDLSEAIAVTDSNYIGEVRIQLLNSFSGDTNVDFAYIGFTDDLNKIVGKDVDAVEYSSEFRNNVDQVYVDGGTTNKKSETPVVGTMIEYYGWLAVENRETVQLSYVITDAYGIETVVDLHEIDDITRGVNSYAVSTNSSVQSSASSINATGYTVKFVANLYNWRGQTVTISIRDNLEDGSIVQTCSIQVSVPEADIPGWIDGSELLGVLQNSTKYTANIVDGNIVVTNETNEKVDGTFNIKSYASGLTPKYAVLKYKTSNAPEVYIYTSSEYGADGKALTGGNTRCDLKMDNQWHILVVDLTKSSHYVQGNPIHFMRVDIAEGVGQKVEIEYIYLCESFKQIEGESVDNVTANNNVDYVFINGNTDTVKDTNCKGMDTIAATSVNYIGWVGINGYMPERIWYVITDAEGNEVERNVTHTRNESVANRYYDADYLTKYVLDELKYVEGSKGYMVRVNADLSAYRGQTVNLSIRVAFNGGAVFEHYSVDIIVPKTTSAELITGAELLNYVGYVNGDGEYVCKYNYIINDDGTLTLTAKATGDNYTDWFTSEVSGVSAPRYAVIRYKTSTETLFGMHARTETAEGYKKLRNPIYADEQWHTLVVDLTQSGQYHEGEKITDLRIDPCPTEGGSITIDYMLLTNDLDKVEFDIATDRLDCAFVGQDLIDMVTAGNWVNKGIASAELNADGNVIITSDSSGDNNIGNIFDGSFATGQYVVIKYRSALETNVRSGVFRVLASTQGNSWSTGGHTIMGYAVADHNWHVLVINLADLASVTDTDGVYYLNEFRVDIMNQFEMGGSVEFAYIGFCDDLNDIILEEGEYLEYSWQNYTAALDEVTLVNGGKTLVSNNVTKDFSKDGSDYRYKTDSCGASDRFYTYEADGSWSWSGWFAVDGQKITDVSVCVTDENGVEHWTSFGAPSERADLTNYTVDGVLLGNYAEVKLGYATGTLCYKAAVSADLGDYAGQTVTVSVRAMTEAGHAVVIYSVFITVPPAQ